MGRMIIIEGLFVPGIFGLLGAESKAEEKAHSAIMMARPFRTS